MNTPPQDPQMPPPGRLLSLLALNLQLTGLRHRGVQMEDLAPTTRDALKDLFNRATAQEKGAH